MCFLKVLESVGEISYTALYQISPLFMLVSKQYVYKLVSLMHIDINIYKRNIFTRGDKWNKSVF